MRSLQFSLDWGPRRTAKDPGFYLRHPLERPVACVLHHAKPAKYTRNGQATHAPCWLHPAPKEPEPPPGEGAWLHKRQGWADQRYRFLAPVALTFGQLETYSCRTHSHPISAVSRCSRSLYRSSCCALVFSAWLACKQHPCKPTAKPDSNRPPYGWPKNWRK